MRSAPAPPKKPRRFRLLRWVFIVGVTYGATALFVSFLQTRLIFFPSREIHSTPRDVGLDFDEVSFKTSDGVSLSGWWVPARRPRAALIFCHGNAGNIADRLGALRLLHGLGLDVLLFDYRGYGKSEGTPTEAGTYADADAAWKFLTEQRRVPAARVLWFGESLGGAVAIEAALRHPPAALIVEATFTSLVDVGRIHYPLLPVGLLLHHRYESIRKIGAISCPKLFIHAREDELVPIENARRLFAAAAEPKEFLETGGGHNTGGFAFNDESYAALAKFLGRLFPRNSSD